ncbi:uncharacterized protein TNCV_4373741 [Trichonephila clavipes]|uniref:Uncharacterized protein n=1 Tax=Trichonephila clavipes TaxID=2585209 RepID=A0A8X6R9D0_TRICX|nr:uncharacterized protein TNCV_4373741 [Trichonephila clavipes]
MPKFEGPYRVLEVRNNNMTIWKKRRRVTVNISQVRVYHPRHSDTNSFDSTNEILYGGKGSSNGSSRLNPGKSRSSRKPSGDESQYHPQHMGTFVPTKEGSRRGAKVQYDKAQETRTTGAASRSPKEYQRSTGIDSLPQNSIRRRSLNMKALDGDPAYRST